MSNDDDIPPDDETPKTTRDKRGRWKPGHCPNKKGRPKKKRFEDYNPSDIRHFANTQIELMINGRPEKMDRRTALMFKTYQGAMNGNRLRQKMMLELFAQNDERIASLKVYFDKLRYRWILDNPDFKGMDELPVETRNELYSLATLLNHYFPGQYKALLG